MSIKEGDNKEVAININEMGEIDFQRWQTNFPLSNQIQLISNSGNNNLNNCRFITISNADALNFVTDGSNNFFLNSELLMNDGGFEINKTITSSSNDNFCVDDLIDNCIKTNEAGRVLAITNETSNDVTVPVQMQTSAIPINTVQAGKTIPITDLTDSNGEFDKEMRKKMIFDSGFEGELKCKMIKIESLNEEKAVPEVKRSNSSSSSDNNQTIKNITPNNDTIKKEKDSTVDSKATNNSNNDVSTTVSSPSRQPPSSDRKAASSPTSNKTKKEEDVDELKIDLPTEPYKLLENLMPLLDINGGLKEHDSSFVKIMKCCEYMPTQCILINVIRSTSASIIKKLLVRGVWSQLYAWLQEACTQINKPLMLELLQLFKLLPINTQLLKSNSCARDIKQLIKNSDERVARLARVIVDEWMKVVKGPNATTTSKSSSSSSTTLSSSSSPSSGDKLKKKSTEDRSRNNSNNNTSSTISNQSDKKQTNLDKNKNNNNNNTVTSDKNINMNSNKSDKHSKNTTSNSSSNSNSSTKDSSIDKKDRPKTVKVKPHKFRMTGLEDVKVGSNSGASSVGDAAEGANATKSLNKFVDRKNSNNSNVAATPNAGDVKSVKNKATAAVAKQISPEVFEKSLFMDALQASTSPTLPKRKRKLILETSKPTTSSSNSLISSSSSSSSSSTTLTTSPSISTPSPSATTNSVLLSSSSPPVSVSLSSLSSPTSTTSATFSTTTTTTMTSQNDDTIPSKRSRLSPDISTQQQQLSQSSSSLPSSVTASASSSSSSVTTKLKKSVTWASDIDLCSFHYFEFDADERCNVNNKKSSISTSNSDFQDHRKHELEMERELLFGKNHSKNRSCESTDWHCPALIEFIEVPTLVPGCESEEKKVQAKRETLVLQVIYFDRERIPDSPAEPDESQPTADQSQETCKLIPLDDIVEDEPMDESQPAAIDTNLQDADNKLILPEALTNLLDSYMHNNNNNNNNQLHGPNTNFTSNPINHFEQNQMNNQSNYYNQPYNDQSGNNNNMPVYPIGFNANNNSNMERKSYDPGYMYNDNNLSYGPRLDNPNFPNHRHQYDEPRKRFHNRGRGGIKNFDNRVCQFYLAGNCRFGNKCKKLHPPN